MSRNLLYIRLKKTNVIFIGAILFVSALKTLVISMFLCYNEHRNNEVCYYGKSDETRYRKALCGIGSFW